MIKIFFTHHNPSARNSQRNRELTLKAQEQALETRQTQLFMQIYQDMSSPEHYIRSNELLAME
jgi:hypothetical protein